LAIYPKLLGLSSGLFIPILYNLAETQSSCILLVITLIVSLLAKDLPLTFISFVDLTHL